MKLLNGLDPHHCVYFWDGTSRDEETKEFLLLPLKEYRKAVLRDPKTLSPLEEARRDFLMDEFQEAGKEDHWLVDAQLVWGMGLVSLLLEVKVSTVFAENEVVRSCIRVMDDV